MFSRILDSFQIKDDVFSRAVNTCNLRLLQRRRNFCRRRFQQIAFFAEPDGVNGISSNAFGETASNSFYFRELRHSFIGVLLLQKRSLIQFFECLLQLFLRVHHNRAVPGDRLFQRLAGDEKKSNAIVSGLHSDFIAAIEKNE